jgi:hypothetical protein
MANMIPALAPETIENIGERDLYVALRDRTPKEWVCRYHYVYCRRRDSSFLRDGEIDFVVIVPGQGLMVLEAKSSHGFEVVDGQWYRLDRFGQRTSKADNPFDQAAKNKHDLIEILCERLGVTKDRFPGLYGHAVVYPRASRKGALPASQDPSVLLAAADMGVIQQRLADAIRQWGHQSVAEKFTDAVTRRVVDVLADAGRAVPVAYPYADDDDRRIQEITRRQYQAFKGLLANTRVIVSGPAGSGKTMIAMWAADHLARDGSKVLFLCFNRVLADWLRSTAEVSSRVTIASFHALCREYVQRAEQKCRRQGDYRPGLRFDPPTDTDEQVAFWTTKAAQLMCDAIEVLGEELQFDAVIVDEAQDFAKDWWVPVELLLRDPSQGRLYVFHDPAQAPLYGNAHSLPDIPLTYALEENCRNTRCIAAYCGTVIARPAVTFERAPVGVLPSLSEPIQETARHADEARRVVGSWLNDGFRPHRIAVLSPWSQNSDRSVLSRLTKVGTVPLVIGEAGLSTWLKSETILGSTVKGFKGLEADCVLICDVPPRNTPGFQPADMYVAASRARHRLHIIPTNPQAAESVRAWLKDARDQLKQ